MIRDFRHRNKWIPVNKSGPVSYRIRTDSGMVVRRHVTKRLDPATNCTDTDTSFEDYPAPPATQESAPESAPRYPQRGHLTGIRLTAPDRLMSLIMEV